MVIRKRKHSIRALVDHFQLATRSFVSILLVENVKIDVLQNMSCCIPIDAKFDPDFESVYFTILILPGLRFSCLFWVECKRNGTLLINRKAVKLNMKKFLKSVSNFASIGMQNDTL